MKLWILLSWIIASVGRQIISFINPRERTSSNLSFHNISMENPRLRIMKGLVCYSCVFMENMRWVVDMAGDPKKAEVFINALTGAQTQALSRIIYKHVGSGMMTIFRSYVAKLFPDESDEVRDPLVH